MIKEFDKETVHVYAVNRLLYEHKIDLRAGEDEKLNQQGIDSVKDYLKKQNDVKRGVPQNGLTEEGNINTNNFYWSFVNMRSRVYSLREQYVIDSILKDSSGSSTTNFIVYGGDHDFKPKIRQWNLLHPDKFSLIIITPDSYVGREDLLKALREKRKK